VFDRNVGALVMELLEHLNSKLQTSV
jgi:hypothetical protein